MSGFEVIGVVLALWPMVANAVALYKATKEGRGSELLLHELDTEELIFRDFVRHLIAAEVSEADLLQLSDRNRPNVGLWGDKGLHAHLESRLGHDKSEVVLKTLKEMDKLLESLRQKISTNNVDTKTTRWKFKSNISQMRHNLPTSSFRQDLDSLKWHNMQLTRLLTPCTSSSHLGHGKQTGSPPSIAADVLRQNSAHANELFDAICESYNCQCSFPHEAHLGLRQDSPKFLDASEPFELIFPVKDISEDMSELDLKSPTSPSDISAAPTEDGDASDFSRRCWSRNNSVSPPREQRGRSVSFSNGQIGVENVGLIDDLCRFVKELDDTPTSSTQNSCLGVLGAKEKKYTVRITSIDGDASTTHSVVCMDDCLIPSETWDLSRKMRMDLALSLSLVILQFYSTPWIDMWWTWKDLSMLKDQKSQVFVNRKFYSTQNPMNAMVRQSSHAASTSTFWAIYGEPVLTRLGFALVELALGKRLSQFRSPNEDQSQDEDMLDLQTAKNVVESGLVLEEAGQIYHDAVQACLSHQVIMPSEVKGLNSKHPNFQQDLEQFVVGPIRNLYTTSWPQVAF